MTGAVSFEKHAEKSCSVYFPNDLYPAVCEIFLHVPCIDAATLL